MYSSESLEYSKTSHRWHQENPDGISSRCGAGLSPERRRQVGKRRDSLQMYFLNCWGSDWGSMPSSRLFIWKKLLGGFPQSHLRRSWQHWKNPRCVTARKNRKISATTSQWGAEICFLLWPKCQSTPHLMLLIATFCNFFIISRSALSASTTLGGLFLQPALLCLSSPDWVITTGYHRPTFLITRTSVSYRTV